MLGNLGYPRPTRIGRLGGVVRARLGLLTLGALASCGGAQSQDCATPQSIASYAHKREVTAESQHASSGGYLEFGERRCTVYVEYVQGQALRLRLWTAHHCFDPTQGQKPILALYDRGRYVEYPVLLDDVVALGAAQKRFVSEASAKGAASSALEAKGPLAKAFRASFSGVPRVGDSLEPASAQCQAFEAAAQKGKGNEKSKEKNNGKNKEKGNERVEKGTLQGAQDESQRVCASYHDLVVFEASLPETLSEPARALLSVKADAQAKAHLAGLRALPESSRTFVSSWRASYDAYLFYKRLSSLGAFYRDALVAENQCSTRPDANAELAPSSPWCGLDALVSDHVDERLASIRDGRGRLFDAAEALSLLERLKEEPMNTREAVARRYFMVESFEAFEAAVTSLKGEALRRFLLRGADLLVFYAGKRIEDAWARLELGSGSSEVSLSRAPFLFHSNVSFLEGNSGRANPAKDKSLLGPYFVKRQAVSLAGAGAESGALGLKVAGGALLFERPLTADSLRVLPGDSGSLFTLFDLPVAVVSMVNGAPTSGGQVLRPLPKQTAEQEPPGEG
ncbi:MAG: hypothetical protein IOD12_04035, partial [Silvanigrellales bacterium]|nr:hypothetical protein [Silvanigrellales bacterium]